MAKRVEIAGVRYTRGQKTAGQLVLGRRSAGDVFRIPLNLVIGASDGPRLVLVFCQHGDEWITLEGWHRLFAELDPSQLAGEIVALPAANPVAFEFKSRNSWIDALHGAHGNLNRAWPGDASGWLTERIAHAISSRILAESDCVIDLHDGSPGNLSIYYCYLNRGFCGSDGAFLEDLCKGFGMEILIGKALPLRGTLTEYLNSIGCLNLCVEVGHFFGFDGERHRLPREVTMTGILNIMKLLKMVDGEVVLPPRQAIVEPETRVKAVNGGLLLSHVEPKHIGTVFSNEVCLFEIIDVSTQESIEAVHGPYENNFLLTSPARTVVVGPGDHGCHVADASTLRWVENRT